MTTTAINITYVDNELYVLAIPMSGSESGKASSELFHYVSGNNAGMNVTIVPQNVLASGQYTLSFVGVNWGGPSGFAVSLTTDGTVTSIGNGNTGNDIGIVWTTSVQITV